MHDGAELAASAEAVASGEAEEETEVVDLEEVGELGGIGAGEEFLEVLEEDFAGDVVAVALFLKRLAGPVGKDGMAEVEDGLVDECDDGEDGEFDVFLGVASVAGGVVGGADAGPDLGAKGSGIGDGLAVAAQAFADGNEFLKYQGKVLGSRVRVSTLDSSSSPAYRFPGARVWGWGEG